jgi:hypothetical protein
MEVASYRKRPVVIEAVQLTLENRPEVAEWCGGEYSTGGFYDDDPGLDIPTLEGVMSAKVSDWIIQGVQGEFYPCKHDIFVQTYEAVQF